MRKVREVRVQRGLTIDDVFWATRIDRASLSRLERGGVLPTAEQRALLARFYGLTEEELFPEFEGIGPEHDRDLFRQLRRVMTMPERLRLLEPRDDYAEYRRRLVELAEKYGIEV